MLKYLLLPQPSCSDTVQDRAEPSSMETNTLSSSGSDEDMGKQNRAEPDENNNNATCNKSQCHWQD